MRVSVAMCTYNGAAYLREQLESIARQTRLPDELVICDDGSSDATPNIVEEFARTVSFPVKFFRNPQNLGSTRNFEKAIGLCTCDLIALSDQDDIWMPEKLSRQAIMMENEPQLGGVFTDAHLMDAESKINEQLLWSRLAFTPQLQMKFQRGGGIAQLLKKSFVTGATLMIRRDVLQPILPIPGSWVHDGWIAWMLAIYSKLALINEPLIAYRVHGNQQFGVPTASLKERIGAARSVGKTPYISIAREYQELERRLAERNDPKGNAILPAVRQKVAFLYERGSVSDNRISRLRFVLRNTRNYHRYFSGLRGMVKDIVI
ncbi:MAG: glycosyltransferase family 2 protein [Acidobacteriaceae bacterium]